MLTADEIKPYLLYEAPRVRQAALEYFAESWSQDETLVPTVLQACDRYGVEENLLALARCSRFPLTEQAFEDVLARLGDLSDEDLVCYHLGGIVANAPVEMLLKHEATILDNPRLPKKVMQRIEYRRQFAVWSGDRLWEELQEFADRSKDKQYAGDINHAYADALVEALAAYEVPDGETVCRLLRSLEDDPGWLEILLIDLAGERRLREAIPILVDKFRIDTDYMLERCMEALAKMGDPQAARLIRDSFPDESWHYKNFTTDVLGKIKHQESERAVIALLESERDIGIRTMLCLSLCQLFSREGVEIVRQQIRSGYDGMIVDLTEELLSVLHMLGIELPEADEWRQRREEDERALNERRRELEELGRKYADLKRRGVDPLAGLGSAREPAILEKPRTYRHSEPKVGRNAPCPCGSGKKYKKCCGRN